MAELKNGKLTRRGLLKAGTAMTALPLLGIAAPNVLAQGVSKSPTNVLDFMTNADLTKAEQEGQLVFYCHENEAGTAGIMEGFSRDFPKIKTSYVRAQTGALYNKILSERSAGRFDVDVIQLSDLAPAFDFQKKGGYEHYVSPESSAYKKDHLSAPNGYFFWTGVDPAGIAYNSEKVAVSDAPKAGRTSSTPAGGARSAARSPRPVCSSCSGICYARFTVTASGRNSPSSNRTPSILACNCSIACPRATT